MPTSYILQTALACLLNAIVTCGVLQLVLKRLMKSNIRYIFTYVFYVAMCFVAVSDGAGLSNVGASTVNYFQLMLYAIAGAAVCIVLFIINLQNQKNVAIYGEEAMQAARKRRKKK